MRPPRLPRPAFLSFAVHLWTLQVLVLACSVLFAAEPASGAIGDGRIIILDCTSSLVASDLTSKVPTVYLSRKDFDASKFNDNGEISQVDFGGLTQNGFKTPRGTIRFKTRKNDDVDVYIITSIRMDTLEQNKATAAPPIKWLSDPIIFVTSGTSRASGPVTTASQPITLSTMRTARFLLKEQHRATALESSSAVKASSLFGVTFKEAPLPKPGLDKDPPAPKVYYYYRQRYKLKFENSLLDLSFEDQSGNQQQVASVITGASENWFLMAGGPVYAYNPDTNISGNSPTGLYVGLNWTPNDIFDPVPRFLIVNVLAVNTTNPTSAVGLVGLGMGFPKMRDFIPLSTLSVTETLVYNLERNEFQFLTMINYDMTDLLQLLKL